MSVNIRRQTTKPPPSKKHVRDWTGLRVRTLRDMRNGRHTLPAGTLATVVRAGFGKGLEIESEKCSTCGVQMTMTCVTDRDVEIVTPVTDRPVKD